MFDITMNLCTFSGAIRTNLYSLSLLLIILAIFNFLDIHSLLAEQQSIKNSSKYALSLNFSSPEEKKVFLQKYLTFSTPNEIKEAPKNLIDTENAKFENGMIIFTGDPFYQSINGTVTSTRILNVEGISQSEVSFFENALINGNITILNQGTFLESLHPNKIIGKGKGIITSSDRQIVTWNAVDIGKVTRNGSIIYQGFIYFDTNSKGSLSFLKDSVGLYISIVGGEASQRNIWQWTVK